MDRQINLIPLLIVITVTLLPIILSVAFLLLLSKAKARKVVEKNNQGATELYNADNPTASSKPYYSVESIWSKIKTDLKIINQFMIPWLLLATLGQSLVEFGAGPPVTSPNFRATGGLNLFENLIGTIGYHDPLAIGPLAIMGQILFILALGCFWADIQRHWAGLKSDFTKENIKLMAALSGLMIAAILFWVSLTYLSIVFGNQQTQRVFNEQITQQSSTTQPTSVPDINPEQFLDNKDLELALAPIGAMLMALNVVFYVSVFYFSIRLLPLAAFWVHSATSGIVQSWKLTRGKFWFLVSRVVFLTLPAMMVQKFLRIYIESNKDVFPFYSASVVWAAVYSLSIFLSIAAVTLLAERLVQQSPLPASDTTTRNLP